MALRPRGCAQPLLTYGSFAEYPAARATLTTFGSIQIKYGRARLKRPPRPKGGWGGAVGVNRCDPWAPRTLPGRPGFESPPPPTVGGRLDHFVPHRQK